MPDWLASLMLDHVGDSPRTAIFLLSVVTALLLRTLWRLNQRLQRSYDLKAD